MRNMKSNLQTKIKKEIRKIYNYIKDNLYAENAAKRIMNKIEEFTSI